MKLSNDQKGQILEIFFNRMALRSSISESQKSSWKSQSLAGRNPEDLIQGLEYLMRIKVSPVQLKKHEMSLAFLIDKNDPVSPLPRDIDTLESPILYHNRGHVPFLVQPEKLIGLLK